MFSGGTYRAVSALGAVVLVVLSVLVGNLEVVQSAPTVIVPIFNRLPKTILSGKDLRIAVLVSVAIMLVSLWPMFKPRPRRLLDTIMLTQRRVLSGGLALATVGYFDYTYRLPRSTLILTVATLLFVLPLWFVLISHKPGNQEKRGVIIGDDPTQMDAILNEVHTEIIGYVSPPSPFDVHSDQVKTHPITTDGSGILSNQIDDLPHRGGLSRLEDILVDYDVDTAYFALRSTDRGEFFGALKTCHEHGVTAKAHRNHIDSVLIDADNGQDIVEVNLEPWDWQDYALKRTFDVTFAAIGLLLTAPLLALIAIAIKFDSPGPVLYSQERTAELGGTFQIYKFRSMLPESESVNPVDDKSNNRITRVGRVLRRTHLDEVPQLWSIFTGKMSVVGPRAAWIDEEPLLEKEAEMWRKRWFVKPGLTGLAQINDVSSTKPTEKLRYDLAYIRRQSPWLDLKIVIRQLWLVLLDVVAMLKRKLIN